VHTPSSKRERNCSRGKEGGGLWKRRRDTMCLVIKVTNGIVSNLGGESRMELLKKKKRIDVGSVEIPMNVGSSGIQTIPTVAPKYWTSVIKVNPSTKFLDGRFVIHELGKANKTYQKEESCTDALRTELLGIKRGPIIDREREKGGLLGLY